MIYPNIRYNFYWHELGQCYRFYYFFETKKRLAGFSEQFCQKQTEILYILYWRVQYSLLWYMSIRLSGSSACLCVHLYLEVFANRTAHWWETVSRCSDSEEMGPPSSLSPPLCDLHVGHSFWPRRLIFGMRDPWPGNMDDLFSNF